MQQPNSRRVAGLLAVDCKRLAAAMSQLGETGQAVALVLRIAAPALIAGNFDGQIERALCSSEFVASVRWLDRYTLTDK